MCIYFCFVHILKYTVSVHEKLNTLKEHIKCHAQENRRIYRKMLKKLCLDEIRERERVLCVIK